MSAVGAAPASPSVGERWRRLTRTWQAVLILAAALVVASLASQFAGGLLNSPRSPIVGAASSYDTSGKGVAALTQLLRDDRHPVKQLSVPLRDASLTRGSTVFVLDPAPGDVPGAAAMRGVLTGGGRLVLAGRTGTTVAMLRSLGGGRPPTAGGFAGGGGSGATSAPASPLWRPRSAGNAHPVAHTPEVRGVSSVLTGSSGSFSLPAGNSEFHVLLRGQGGPFALIARLGGGSVVLLASSEPLENSSLGHADDAAFGLDLAGPAATPVAFDEYDHGAGRTSPGLSGLPGHWKAALILALAALLLWLWAASRRFGPPELAERDLIPPRVAHVDAMATLLSAGPPTRLAEGAAPLRSAARERLRRRVRAEPATSDEELSQRAADEGVPAEIVGALLCVPGTADELVALGRAAAAIGTGPSPSKQARARLTEGQTR